MTTDSAGSAPARRATTDSGTDATGLPGRGVDLPDGTPAPRGTAEPDEAASAPVRTAPVVPHPVSGTGPEDEAAEPSDPAPPAPPGRVPPVPPVPAAPSAPSAPSVNVFAVPSARGPVAVGPPRSAARRRRAAAVPLAACDAVGTVTAVLVCAGGQAAPLLLASTGASVLALCTRAGLYRPCLDPQALDELPALGARVAAAWCVGVTVLAVCGGSDALSLAGMLAGVALTTALACAARALVHGLRRRRGRRSPRAALIVGRGGTARAVTAALLERSQYGLRPVALVEPAAEDAPGPPSGADACTNPCPLPVVATLEEVARQVARSAVQDVVFVRSPWEEADTAALAGLLGRYGVTGWLVRPGCALGAHGPHASPGGGPTPDAHLWGFSCRRLVLDCPRPRTGLRKRVLDLALVVPALVAAAPVLAACALAVRLLDGPGVLFRQERIGQGGRPFTLLKFRTVRPSDQHEAATRWTVAGDTRTSRIGRLLRRSSLDELPQLWNVVRGDMSLVGPRPERPFFVRQFSQLHPGYAQRHRTPVGITGLAQVHGLRGDTSIEDRARFDNHYIETWSLWQDVRIMCRTATSFFRLEGR
ncbi:exopolysaccharide biosynthesis polyprenyl glycosylphosphotransferase [Streptomyces tubbatahanensis]|uniref:Exopolysaccharide biosynthesis polyprenyl glycosylphosphotransferase n=1 Tax=Streptomyces tubbatahanensis TaxID=2923272 RepID=A0ABY3Y0J4_9ACTN|nr:exopolysaccharide biosynthesis polyprenyl glycosylphosphotransferase [Streptomyces tubbatahanensis]UNT00176.1 exopolysaccharide biosynthesis polyprenyl glycosylphosphotransferase [Streptomyces tubbatahanensis]